MAAGTEFHFLAEQFGKAGGNGLQGKSGIGFVLGTAQMGGEDKAGALVQQELDGGEGGHDAGVIGNFPILEGDVEIHAHQDFLSLGIKVTYSKFSHIGLYCLVQWNKKGRAFLPSRINPRPPGQTRFRNRKVEAGNRQDLSCN